MLQAASSAIDIALHDIKGEALGAPVHHLLGRRQRDRVRTFASTSAPPGEAMIEQARELMAAGWTANRFFPAGQDSMQVFEPRGSIGATARWIVKAREALGDAVAPGMVP